MASSPRATQALMGCVAGLLAFGYAGEQVSAQPPRPLPVTLIRQQTEFDCGSAALATLLSFYADEEVEPARLIGARPWASDEWQGVQRDGFSLSQLAEMAAALNVQTSVLWLPIRSLSSIQLPVLVYLPLPSGPHFSVLTGIAGEHVTLADPSQGALLWTLGQFLSAWAPEGEGALLLVRAAPVW